MSKINRQQYRESITKMLADRDLRILLWRLIKEDCRVFQEEFPNNAMVYSLLGKQEIGKRLLADAKNINASAVFMAEAEYDDLMKQVEYERELEVNRADEQIEGER